MNGDHIPASIALSFKQEPAEFCGQSSRGRGRAAICPLLATWGSLVTLQRTGRLAGPFFEVQECMAFLIKSPQRRRALGDGGTVVSGESSDRSRDRGLGSG